MSLNDILNEYNRCVNELPIIKNKKLVEPCSVEIEDGKPVLVIIDRERYNALDDLQKQAENFITKVDVLQADVEAIFTELEKESGQNGLAHSPDINCPS